LLKNKQEQKIVEFTVREPGPQIITDGTKNLFQIKWNAEMKSGSVVLRDLDRELPEFLQFLRQNAMQLDTLDSRKISLDDLFIGLTGRHLND
jgi:ABC-2 type transport system ATP-binding protein